MPLDITTDDVIRAAGGDYTPWFAHLEPPLPPVPLDAEGWAAFEQAKRRGYLIVAEQQNRNVEAIWSWWRLASKSWEAVVRIDPRRHRWTVRLDLSPAGLVFTPTALIPIGQAFRAAHTGEDGWIIAPDTVEIDGLSLDAARGVVEALVNVVKHPRCVRRA